MKGRVRLQNYSVQSPVVRLAIRALQYFGRGDYSTLLAQRYGVLKWDTGFQSNVITLVGKAQLALLAGASGTPFTFLAVGTSATAVTSADTALNAELSTLGLSRVAATVSRVTITATNDTLQLANTWSVTGSTTVNEVGVFNASSSGVMLGHALTGAKTVANGDVLVGTYQCQFT